ncbi:MAG: protein BatD [Muribaculaceae bacterium]|nr:protein BatD [Muribaculaceae bacterium]
MKHLIHIIVLLLCSAISAGASVSFTVQAPRQVNEGSKFNVTFVLKNAEGSGFVAPDIPGATKLYGPALSTSYSQSWVNGKSSSSSSQEYTMIYKATKQGRLNVGSAVVDVNGRRMTTKPFTIEVLPPDKAANSQPRSLQEEQRQHERRGVQYDDPITQSADKAVTGNDIFVRIEMSKPRVYEQQAVVCTIKLYTKYQVSQFIPTLQPSFDGFLIEEIPMQPSLNNVETFNGQQYMVAVLKKCILYPQQSGKLTITSGNYDVNVVQYENYRTIFGTLSQPVEKKLVVKSNTATVNILPLPEPKPADFTGAVGHFTVATSINPTPLKTYQAATYSYVITGTGNLKYIKAPVVAFTKQMDVYDPKTNVKVNPASGDMSGSVQIDYPFIPQFAGEFTIPASNFTYFDPETGKYVSVPVPQQPLKVAKGEGAPSNHYRLQNMDIRHLHQGDLHLSKTHTFVIDDWRYWMAFVLPALLMAALMVYYRKQLRQRADVRLMRNKRASKVAQRRLKQARASMNKGDQTAFYADLLTAMWGYMSDKLSIPVSELDKENIQSELTAYGVDPDLTQQAMALLDKCEFAQYAPELAHGDMAPVLDEAATLIGKLENVKRAKTQPS